MRTDHLKVLVPDVLSWIEKRHRLLSGVVKRREVPSFVAIAEVTGKSKMVSCISATVLTSDDVLYVEREPKP